jgi:hypothetical protein
VGGEHVLDRGDGSRQFVELVLDEVDVTGKPCLYDEGFLLAGHDINRVVRVEYLSLVRLAQAAAEPEDSLSQLARQRNRSDGQGCVQGGFGDRHGMSSLSGVPGGFVWCDLNHSARG